MASVYIVSHGGVENLSEDPNYILLPSGLEIRAYARLGEGVHRALSQEILLNPSR